LFSNNYWPTVYYIDMWGNELNNFSNNTFTHIDTLMLRANKLSSFTNNSLPLFKNLDVAQNYISNLNKFFNFPSLKILHLSYNKINALIDVDGTSASLQ
jgi:Leucine-rich repeat (LRR) protein